MRAVLLLFLLAACAGQPGACRLQSVADLPVTLDRNNRMLVPGRIEGTDVPLLIDTGAERTVVTSRTASSLLLARAQRSATRLTGVGGTVSNADAFADLELGGIHVQQRLAVADVPGVGGLVGGDVLSRYDVEFDLPDRRVRLWRESGCGADDLPWHGARAAMPLRITAGHRVQAPVSIDGTPVFALLDSGSGMSLLRTGAALHLGVTQAELESDHAVTGRGVGEGTILVHIHQFASIAVGPDRFAPQRIGVGDTSLGEADMLLGVDYLRHRRVWIAYRSGRMFVQTVTPAN